jgi:ribonuclease Z
VDAVKITFLGTSSGTPTRTRNVTAQALSFENGALWLLDCGEATQHRVMEAGLKAGRIERILITHLHGDHCYGLPGMLACMAIQGRTGPVQIVGPVGLREMVETVLRLSDHVPTFAIDWVEVDGTRSLAAMSNWSVSSHAIRHRITCFGYVLREAPRPGRFHVERARALGIPEGHLFGHLQAGRPVTLADGRTVQPSEVCDPPRPGRKVVLLGDTQDASGIATAAQGCDVLVHEATYEAERTAKAEQWGHSTSAMAGVFAKRIAAKHLIITHFSSRYTDSDADRGVDQLLAEAQRECPGTVVLAADDLWSFNVPFAD